MPPTLEAVLYRLRSLEPELRAKGVRRLWVFGSVARGDADEHSDIDVAAEFDPATRVSIVRLGSIKMRLEEALGREVDFGERRMLTTEARRSASKDAVVVFG